MPFGDFFSQQLRSPPPLPLVIFIRRSYNRALSSFSRRRESARCWWHSDEYTHYRGASRMQEQPGKTGKKRRKKIRKMNAREGEKRLRHHRVVKKTGVGPPSLPRRSFPSSAIVSISAERFTALHPRTPCPAGGKSLRDTGNSLQLN